MMEICSVLQIGENRWQLCFGDDIRAEGTMEAMLAAKRLLDPPEDIEQLLEQGRELRASIESRYARLQTLTTEDFKVRSR